MRKEMVTRMQMDVFGAVKKHIADSQKNSAAVWGELLPNFIDEYDQSLDI